MASMLQTAQKSLWLGWLFDNPLFMREVRRRMRGKLFSWSLILYIFALGLVSCAIILTSYPGASQNLPLQERIERVSRIGSSLFYGVRALELFIAIVIAPLLTSGLAAAEKEKDTFDFLRVTTLRPGVFVAGCLLVTASFLLMVFCCTLPITSLAFIFGGVSLGEVLSFNLHIFLGALAISSAGMFLSTVQRKSASTLGLMSILNIGALLLFGANILRSLFIGTAGSARYMSYFVVAMIIVAAAVCLIGASRRLYESDNRILNYRQFAALALIGLAASAFLLWMVAGNPMASEATFMTAYGAGFALALFGVINFSTGRVQRGDEIWSLRMKRKFFQRVPEDGLFQLAYLILWAAASLLGAVIVGGDAWFRISVTLPALASAHLFALATAYAVTGFAEQRNRGMTATVVILIFVWGALPVAGMILAGAFRFTPANHAFWAQANFYYQISPFIYVRDALDNSFYVSGAGTIASQVLLAAGMFAVTRTRIWKQRTRVSYEWVERPFEVAASEIQPAGSAG